MCAPRRSLSRGMAGPLSAGVVGLPDGAAGRAVCRSAAFFLTSGGADDADPETATDSRVTPPRSRPGTLSITIRGQPTSDVGLRSGNARLPRGQRHRRPTVRLLPGGVSGDDHQGHPPARGCPGVAGERRTSGRGARRSGGLATSDEGRHPHRGGDRVARPHLRRPEGGTGSRPGCHRSATDGVDATRERAKTRHAVPVRP